jgi:hypothetical protein
LRSRTPLHSIPLQIPSKFFIIIIIHHHARTSSSPPEKAEKALSLQKSLGRQHQKQTDNPAVAGGSGFD